MTLQGSLTHDDYCAQLLAETGKFREILRAADLTAKVPTCPDWTLADLARHVGRAHRWVGTLVATRAAENVDDAEVPGMAGPGSDDAAALDAWLAAGVEQAVAALREAGPDAGVWTWSPVQRAGFWARRMTHETVIHRADAALTAGAAFDVPPEVAADCLEEWLQLCALPLVAARHAERGNPLFGALRRQELSSASTRSVCGSGAVTSRSVTGPVRHNSRRSAIR